MESNEDKSLTADVKLEESETTSSSARPKRATKKNVRYSNADFVTSSEAAAAGASEAATSSEGAEPELTSGAETPKGRKRKAVRKSNETAPLLMEPELTDGSQMNVAMEYEIPHDGAASEDVREGEDVEVDDVVADDDDGPPVLDTVDDEFGGEEDSDGDELAPDLERNPLTKKRGRPRNLDSTGAARVPRIKPSPRVPAPPTIAARMASEARLKSGAHQNVRLFMPDLETTPEGDTYATVVPGCLTELLRKERVIELLTNEMEIAQIRASGWLLNKPPRLPPLTTEKACFAFYVDGQSCKNAKELSNDDLRPWTAVMDPTVPNSVNIKPNVRRHAVARLGGVLKIVRSETRLAEYHLTEYNARLPREQRLKKKIFYLSRDHQIYGNVLILYEYMREGTAPVPINLPHGNDYLRRAAVQDVEQNGTDGESPFEDQPYEGDRGGLFMKLRPGRLAWAHNKKNLLDYMYNLPYLASTIVLNTRLPDLPPLIETAGVFAYFAHSENIANQIHHAPDGLSPWTVNLSAISDDDLTSPTPAPRVRSTRRALMTDANGLFSVAKDQKMTTSCMLVETLSTLARCKRVRKRVFYIQHANSHIVGNVCYLYEFVCDGPLPTILTAQEQRQINHMGGRGQRNTPSKHARFDDMMIEHDDQTLAPIDDMDTMHDPREHSVEVIDDGPTEEEQMAMYPDTLNNGYDTDFADDQLEKSENPEPYYDVPRQLSTGHIYLTVRHKKVVTGLDHVLQWIANSNFVEDRGLLNQTKPLHPPLVTNARAYAFFVAGAAIFPHDINRDDFSPWSGNGNSENHTRYRSKVRKIGCAVEPSTSTFMLKDHIDYKMCQFHLVYLYSTNPRDPRMRKKIYYIMETESKMVVSHALIIYDYTSEGRIPKLSAGQYKATPKRNPRVSYAVARDPADDEFVTEEHRPSPFNDQPMEAIDGTMYMAVIDKDFWTDRNRQIQFLVNEPLLIAEMGCLNEKVPDMPPSCTTKGLFVFFVNMNEINIRSLTIDKLVPWSENLAHGPHGGPTIRPKSAKSSLVLNAHGQLRVAKNQEHSEYQIHTYSATLPRCTRLRKKVVYVLRNGGPFGNALIMYSFTENGDDPQPMQKSLSSYANDDWYHMLTPIVREDVDVYMRTMNLSDVKKSLYEVHGLNLSRAQLYALQSAQQPHHHHHHHREGSGGDEDVEIDVDGYGWPTTSAGPKMEHPDQDQLIEHGGHEMMVEEEIIVGHTETVPFDQHHHHHSRRHPFLDKNVTNTGFVRGSQRNEALWRIAQKQFGVDSIDQTFDGIFKLLYQRDEQRLLHNINVMFNVDIVSGEDEQIIEDPQYMHHDEMMVVEEEEVTVDEAPAEYMEQVVVEEEEHVMI